MYRRTSLYHPWL